MKTLAASAVATGLPAIAAASAELINSSDKPVVGSAVGEAGTDACISVVFGTNDARGTRVVTLSNTSNTAVAIKRIYPGLVTVDEQVYDLNSLFDTRPTNLDPGHSVRVQLSATQSASPERQWPAGVAANHTVRVMTPFATLDGTTTVATTRGVLT